MSFLKDLLTSLQIIEEEYSCIWCRFVGTKKQMIAHVKVKHPKEVDEALKEFRELRIKAGDK